MNDKRYGLGNPIIALGIFTFIAILTTVGLWLFRQRVAAAVVGTATLLAWLGLFIAMAVAAGSWWSARLMERGANIALAAQVSDDKRDVQLLKTAGDVVRSVRQSQELPALPLPQQQAEWRPAWPELDVVDVEPKRLE